MYRGGNYSGQDVVPLRKREREIYIEEEWERGGKRERGEGERRGRGGRGRQDWHQAGNPSHCHVVHRGGSNPGRVSTEIR